MSMLLQLLLLSWSELLLRLLQSNVLDWSTMSNLVLIFLVSIIDNLLPPMPKINKVTYKPNLITFKAISVGGYHYFYSWESQSFPDILKIYEALKGALMKSSQIQIHKSKRKTTWCSELNQVAELPVLMAFSLLMGWLQTDVQCCIFTYIYEKWWDGWVL